MCIAIYACNLLAIMYCNVVYILLCEERLSLAENRRLINNQSINQ